MRPPVIIPPWFSRSKIEQLPLNMAVENVDPLHECQPQQLHMGTAKQKKKDEAEKSEYAWKKLRQAHNKKLSKGLTIYSQCLPIHRVSPPRSRV